MKRMFGLGTIAVAFLAGIAVDLFALNAVGALQRKNTHAADHACCFRYKTGAV